MDIFTPFDHNLVIRRLDSINYAVFVGQMTPGKPCQNWLGVYVASDLPLAEVSPNHHVWVEIIEFLSPAKLTVLIQLQG